MPSCRHAFVSNPFATPLPLGHSSGVCLARRAASSSFGRLFSPASTALTSSGLPARPRSSSSSVDQGRLVEDAAGYDGNHDGQQGALPARMAAVVEAQRALAHHEEGPVTRSGRAWSNFAAVAELLADDLPTPRV